MYTMIPEPSQAWTKNKPNLHLSAGDYRGDKQSYGSQLKIQFRPYPKFSKSNLQFLTNLHKQCKLWRSTIDNVLEGAVLSGSLMFAILSLSRKMTIMIQSIKHYGPKISIL